MNLKHLLPSATAILLGVSSLFISCDKKGSSLEARFPDKFEGKTVEMISFSDSVILNSAVIKDGRVLFDNSDLITDEPILVELTIDGRVKAFAVIEPGASTLADSLHVATGTPLNDRFAALMNRLDSVENLDDLLAYVDLADKCYAENRDNPLGNYFGVEVIKFAEPSRVDSLLRTAPESLTKSKKAQRFIRFANLRKQTAPGNRYVDFTVKGKDGKPTSLSMFVKPGRYTIVDFWASWCPYCIKEIPELKKIVSEFGDKGVDIVGVAVRDKTEDTDAAIEKYGIPWSVMYNAQRIPYDIYGFTGIPHLMLIGPDGKIIARGESAVQTADRLKSLLLVEKQ